MWGWESPRWSWSFGPAGLAGAALLTTAATAGVFYRLLRRDFFPPALAWDPAAARRMLTAAFPLMLNGLLIILFFRFDQPIIQTFRGAKDVAIYEAAYKVINFTQIITPSVVLALFPAMAHAALHDRTALTRQYRGAVKFLLLLGAPLVVGTMALAPALITIITLGKPGYLPYSGWALAILIAYLPFSFINGVTQYVLIALHRQARLTWAIGATALSNVGANLLVVPVWGIYGAAVVTVLSEIVLLVPFLRWAAANLGTGALRPGAGGMKLALAAVGLAVVTFGGLAMGWNEFAAALLGGAAYLALLAGLRISAPRRRRCWAACCAGGRPRPGRNPPRVGAAAAGAARIGARLAGRLRGPPRAARRPPGAAAPVRRAPADNAEGTRPSLPVPNMPRNRPARLPPTLPCWCHPPRRPHPARPLLARRARPQDPASHRDRAAIPAQCVTRGAGAHAGSHNRMMISYRSHNGLAPRKIGSADGAAPNPGRANCGKMSHMELLNLTEYEAAARAVLPQMAFDYIAGGADDEITVAANRAAFGRLRLRPRLLAGSGAPDLRVSVCGVALPMPVMVAPMAFHQLVTPDGEIATARAAGAAGALLCVSTAANY